MECPKCDATIHDAAKYCGCGWKRDNSMFSKPEPIVDCAHMGCRIPAMCKIQTKTGWANLCHTHYDKHYADEAHASLDKYGLARMADESQAEHVMRMRQFVKNGFKTIGAKPTEPQQTEDQKKAAIARLMEDWSSDLGSQA